MVPQNSPTSIKATSRAARVAASRLLAVQLKKRIRAGEFNEAGKLPTLRELVAEYGLSQTTVQRAVDLLRDDNLVEYRDGKGNYLRTAPVSRPRQVPAAVFVTPA